MNSLWSQLLDRKPAGQPNSDDIQESINDDVESEIKSNTNRILNQLIEPKTKLLNKLRLLQLYDGTDFNQFYSNTKEKHFNFIETSLDLFKYDILPSRMKYDTNTNNINSNTTTIENEIITAEKVNGIILSNAFESVIIDGCNSKNSDITHDQSGQLNTIQNLFDFGKKIGMKVDNKLDHLSVKSETNSQDSMKWVVLNEKSIGSGLWLTGSLFNHSNDNNASRVMINQYMIIVANKDIEKGEEICISYVSNASTNDKNQLKQWGI